MQREPQIKGERKGKNERSIRETGGENELKKRGKKRRRVRTGGDNVTQQRIF